MRPRAEIERSATEAVLTVKDNHMVAEFTDEVGLLNICLEVLLDIRALLQSDAKPAVTYPVSPPPPEVKR